MMRKIYILYLALSFPCVKVDSACTWPEEFKSSTWLDGFKDELKFNITTMAGWDVTVDQLTVDRWECFRKDRFDSDGFLEMKAIDPIELYNAPYNGYLCLKMSKVSTVSYRYFIQAPQQIKTAVKTEERLHIQKDALSEDETSCSDSLRATGSEYHVMIKSGEEQSASIDCPYVFIGVYGYSITDSGVSSCDTASSDWNMCDDTKTMTFDKTMCSANVAYTDSPSVVCVDSVPVGTDHLVTVYSSESIDTKFSCFAISYDGTRASVSPRTCKKEQTPSEIPLSSNGAEDGRTVIMEADRKCPTCQLLANISGGSVLYLTDGAVTYATYTCEDQYDLYGMQQRPCQSDNTWAGEAPSCKCKVPTPPVNGNVTVSADGNTATYTCNSGFVLQGSNTRVCQPTNAWNGTEPTCDTCDDIIEPTNGSYSLQQEGGTTIAVFSCNPGTTMSGSNTSTCQSDATWDGTPPTCVTCKTITFGTNGNVTLVTNGMVTSANFSCADGYNLVGDALLTCDIDGIWNGDTPICECSPPVKPDSGDVQADGSLATYSCVAGFNMNGERKRYCQNDGLGWNGTAPTCEKCAVIGTLSGGNVNISTDGRISSVEFTCDVEFTLKGKSMATCLENRTWDQAVPECVKCQQLNAIPSGNLTMTTDGLITLVIYACADGYSMEGTAVQTCDSNGLWSASPPSCQCISPTEPANGEIYSSNSDNNIVYYYCNLGFSLSTESFTRTCSDDGSGWSGQEPTCLECPQLSDPEGGKVNYTTTKFKTSAHYFCEEGYSIDGDKTVVCTEAGKWESNTTKCTKCTEIGTYPGRSNTTYTDGFETKATFSCDAGYTLDGSKTAICDRSGTWTPSLPTCAKCADKHDPNSGNVTISTDGQTTRAKYSCLDGYYLVGGLLTLSCLTNGEWDGPDPVCKCIAPSAPVSGSVVLLSNGKIASYSCDIGFTLNGSAERTCGDDGSGWSGTDPSCVLCDTIPDIPVGYFNLTSTNTVTKMEYTCPEGSSIHGNSVLECDSSGSWGVDAFPTCETCTDLSAPTSGSVSISSDGSLTTAAFACFSGYELVGKSVLTCQSNGEWDFSAPSCVCKAPTEPDFGSVEISLDRLTVSYGCDIGYTLNGDPTRVCLDGGTGWNGTDPSCVSCPDVTTPDGGSVNLTTSGTETEVVYKCDLGSSLEGSPHSKCLPDGTWEVVDSPTCVSCDPLANPATGSVNMTTDGVTTIATYTCLPGYEVVGSNTTSCQTNGEWNQTNIQCYCKPPDTPPNGTFSLSEDRSTIIFNCDEGFTLTGSASRTCLTDGSGWTETTPNCTYCDTLPELLGGNIALQTNGTVTTAQLSCDQGYTITGSTEVTCQEDGTWDIGLPECVSCPTVDPPKSGEVSVVTNGTVSMAKFSCEVGYYMVGEPEITCGTNGNWSNENPVCVCLPPSEISNGHINISQPTVTYSCDIGFSINGNVIRTCQEDGSGWTGTDPACAGCESLDTPLSATQNLKSDGTVTSAMFECDLGATIKGPTILTCQSDGTWNAIIPECVSCPLASVMEPVSGAVTKATNGTTTTAAFTCAENYDVIGESTLYCQTDGTWSSEVPTCLCKESKVPAPENGSLTISADGQMVNYSCDVGFTLKGDVQLVCKNDSTGWSGTPPTCVSCPSLAGPVNGTVVITTDGSLTVAEYSCSVETSMNGNQYLTCLESGSWSAPPPTCVLCPTLLDPSNGNVTITTDGVTSVATYTCKDMYKIVGATERRCSSAGSWNDLDPYCTCEDPPIPTNGAISRTEQVDLVSYTCDTKYTLSGLSARLCDSNGEGWVGSDPTCVECQPLSEVVNGTLSYSTTGLETIVSIACNVGSSMSGSSNIKCNSDGSWTMSLPDCNECDATPITSNGQFNLETDGVTTTATLGCSAGYEVTGTGSVRCDSDGSWSIVGEQTCAKVESAKDDEENPLLAPLIAVSVVAFVVIAVLSAILARLAYLRRRRQRFGDGHYTKYETEDNQQQNGGIHREPTFIHPPPKDLISIPLVPFEKTQAPLSHEQHVLERGKTSISLAPWSHQSHVMESNMSPRGIAPADTDVGSRSPSQASVSHVDISSFPPLPSVIRPPSSKSATVEQKNGKLNSVKLVHSSSNRVNKKPKKSDDDARPMTPVNF